MTRICAHPPCGQSIPDRRKDTALYCSNACKVAASKGRRSVADAIPLTVDEKRFPGVSPNTRHVLQALAAAGGNGATTAELCQPNVGGCRFGARIHSAREYGYVIREQRIRNGQSRYWLVSVPGRPVLDVEDVAA